ncbi:unnamed protein product [Prorocentrum cordatum]|uniref:Uncharacterized protein n=1 Tax=Prorocentrum cordatum TaxID=2364126 RepID=A0ABN9XMW4_9DINO|nr:unnamed protein product [Polarella glacialis]
MARVHHSWPAKRPGNIRKAQQGLICAFSDPPTGVACRRALTASATAPATLQRDPGRRGSRPSSPSGAAMCGSAELPAAYARLLRRRRPTCGVRQGSPQALSPTPPPSFR